MDKISIRVRKEVIKCKKCGNPKAFFYLSDFAYGQKLIFFNNTTECAFANMLEDKYFLDYVNIVKKILSEEADGITEEIVDDVANETFGITCDLIHGCKIDFSESQKKCELCGTTEFERNMIEPESLIQMDVATISHNNWENLNYSAREELVKNELISRKMIL